MSSSSPPKLLSCFVLVLFLVLNHCLLSESTSTIQTSSSVVESQRQSQKLVALAGIWTTNTSDHQQAFQLAIQDVMADPSWPAGWTLQGISKQSECHPATGVGALIEVMKVNPNIVGVVGPDCSDVAVRLTKLAQYYSLPVISPAATDPSLSDNSSYPLFTRTVTSETQQAEIWISIMKHFSWRTIATLNSDEDDMRATIQTFQSLAVSQGFEVFSQSFPSGQFDESLLQNISNKGNTVIILATYPNDSFTVLEKAAQLGLTTTGYAWLGTYSWQFPNFWMGAPNPTTVMEAAQGSLSASFIAGTGTVYARLVNTVGQNGGKPGLETGYVYDATLAMGKAIASYLTDFESIDNLDGDNLTMRVRNQAFVGATGNVKFDNETGDRKELVYAIGNLVGDQWRVVGGWNEVNLLTISNPITFSGNSQKVPLDEQPGVLRILGLFPVTGSGWPIGQWVEPAFQLAIEDGKALLPPGWTLDGFSNDTKCDAGTGMAEIVDAHDQSDVLAVIGPGCSDVSTPCSLLTISWNIPIISWGSTAPALSDNSVYPTFFRVVNSDYAMSSAWVAFCKHFGWTSVAVLFSTDVYPQNIAEQFVTDAAKAGITTYTESFISDVQLNSSTQLDGLRKKSTVFFLSCSERDAAIVMKTAMEMGLTKEPYAWIGTDAWQVPGFGINSMSPDEIDYPVIGSLGIGLLPGTGPEYETFVQRLETQFDLNTTVVNTAYAYDATMILITRIVDMINSNQNPRNKELLMAKLSEGVSGYQGLTGLVDLDTTGERKNMTFVIKNYYNAKWNEIGYAYQDQTGTITFNFTGIPIFPGNTTSVPSDVPQKKDFALGWAVRYVFLIITIVLILLLLLILAIFISKKEEKIIRLSSVSMGVLTMFGIVLYYICVFLLYPEPTDHTCLAYIWVLKIAFCFTFGCLFVKTLKLWRSYTSPENTPTDLQLFIGVAIIVLFGIGYLILWTAIDPYKLDYKTDPTDETVRWLVCRSKSSAWKWAAFGLELGFMILGAMLAWKVRNVPTQANESHSVAYSIYNMFIIQVVMFSVVYSTDADPNVNFALESVTVLAIGTGVLLIVFGTKLFQVYFPSNSRSGSSSFGSTIGKSKVSTNNTES